MLSLFTGTPLAYPRDYLDVAKGQLMFGDWTFDPYALEWPDAFTVQRNTLGCLSVLSGFNSHGVNTILLSAQDNGFSLYGHDGKLSNPAAGQTYKQILETCRFHLFPTIVNLFSARPADRLDSPAAYREAVRTAVRDLSSYYYGILLVGDVVTGQRWTADAPFPLDRPDNVLVLSREISKIRPGLEIGVPADIFPGYSKAGQDQPLIYVFKKIQAAEPLIAHLSKPDAGPLPTGIAGDVAVLKADRVLRRIEAGGAYPSAMAAYLRKVEQQRLAIQAPPMVEENHQGKGHQVAKAGSRESPGTQPDAAADAILTPQEKADGWVSLFDGSSLDGWTTLRPDWGAWGVENGTITCRGSYLGPWLRTRKRFANFMLRLEYRIIDKGNSGVFVRAPLDGRSSRFGYEIQIMGRQLDQLDDQNSTGAIYAALPPKVDASRPANEWNDMEITCDGPRITVLVNGRNVQDFDTRSLELLKDRLREGVIGLQDHGNKVWFRRIRIRELQSSSRPSDP